MDHSDDIDEPIACDGDDSSWASPAYSATAFEQECLQLQEVEDDRHDLEGQFTTERDASSHKLWLAFQNSAAAIAQLYQDRHQGVSLWSPFQNAAGSVTSLYKECMDSHKKISELGLQLGTQRRNKELLAWLKKRKRSHIRREDVIAFLCGRSSKPNTHGHHRATGAASWMASSARPRHSLSPDTSTPQGATGASSSALGLHAMRSPTQHNITLTCLSLADQPSNLSSSDAIGGGDLQTFRDALSAVVRNSSQSSFGGPNNTTSSYARRNSSRSSISGGVANLNGPALAELNAFITEEFTRNMSQKRAASSTTDVLMESPTHKKPKFL